jgi:hypothetical protein
MGELIDDYLLWRCMIAKRNAELWTTVAAIFAVLAGRCSAWIEKVDGSR